MITYFLTDRAANIYINNKSYVITNTHAYFEDIGNLLKEGCQDSDKLLSMLDLKQKLKDFTGNRIKISNGVITPINNDFNLQPFINYLVKRFKDGDSVDGILNFIDQCSNNENLFKFVKDYQVPVLMDGSFLVFNTNDTRCSINRFSNSNVVSVYPADVTSIEVTDVLVSKFTVVEEAKYIGDKKLKDYKDYMSGNNLLSML